MMKRTWWTLSLRKWTTKMISIQPMKSCTMFIRNMRNYIGWPPKSWVMWNLIEKSFPRSLMKPIRPLEHCDLRTTSLLKRQRSLKQNYYRLVLNWRGLLVQSSIRCLAFRNLLLIESVWSMISLLLILLLLVLLCLSHLLIMLILRTMNVKLIQLVRT